MILIVKCYLTSNTHLLIIWQNVSHRRFLSAAYIQDGKCKQSCKRLTKTFGFQIITNNFDFYDDKNCVSCALHFADCMLHCGVAIV